MTGEKKVETGGIMRSPPRDLIKVIHTSKYDNGITTYHLYNEKLEKQKITC